MGDCVELLLDKPLPIEMKVWRIFFSSLSVRLGPTVRHCGPKRTHGDTCGCMNKQVTEICCNIIPEQATSTSAAEKYLEHSPIRQIHSGEQTGCCRADQEWNSKLPFQIFESDLSVQLDRSVGILKGVLNGWQQCFIWIGRMGNNVLYGLPMF